MFRDRAKPVPQRVSINWVPRVLLLAILLGYFLLPKTTVTSAFARLDAADDSGQVGVSQVAVEPESSETPAPKSDGLQPVPQQPLESSSAESQSSETPAAGESPAQASGDTGPGSTGDQASNSADANPQETKPAAEKADKPAAEPQTEGAADPASEQPAGTEPELPSFEVKDPGQLADLYSLVKDQTLHIHAREMPAYWHLVQLAKKSDMQEMLKSARTAVKFDELYTSPKEHRGDLIRLDLNIRRVMRYPVNVPNREGIKELYEVWGWTNQAKAWMYVIITPELPPDIPVGESVQKFATFAGYFYKLQAYHPGDAKPNAPPLVAPLVVGRFHAVPFQPNLTATDSWGYRTLLLVVLVVVGLSIGYRLLSQFWPRKRRRSEIAITQRDLQFLTAFEAAQPGSGSESGGEGSPADEQKSP